MIWALVFIGVALLLALVVLRFGAFTRLTAWGEHHPTTATGLFVVLVVTLLVYIGAYIVVGAVVHSQRTGCEHDNRVRLTDLRAAQSLIKVSTAVLTERETEDRPTYALREFIAEQRGRVDALSAAAGRYATVPGDAVTVNCTEANPNPLSIGGE